MALTQKKLSNFFSARGTPVSNSVWDALTWDFDARNVKVIMTVASTANLEFSLDGKDVHGSLPIPVANQNPMVYDFSELGISRLFVRGTGAAAEIYAYGVH